MPAMKIKALASCIDLDASFFLLWCQPSIGMGYWHGAQCDGKSGVGKEMGGGRTRCEDEEPGWGTGIDMGMGK